MATIEDVVQAHAEITRAEQRYRELLREALDIRGAQTAIAEALGVTREKVRQDAMTEAEREVLRVSDAKRKADLRNRAKGSAPMATPR